MGEKDQLDKNFHAIHGSSYGGTRPLPSHVITLYIEHHMEEQDLLRLIY